MDQIPTMQHTCPFRHSVSLKRIGEIQFEARFKIAVHGSLGWAFRLIRQLRLIIDSFEEQARTKTSNEMIVEHCVALLCIALHLSRRPALIYSRQMERLHRLLATFNVSAPPGMDRINE